MTNLTERDKNFLTTLTCGLRLLGMNSHGHDYVQNIAFKLQEIFGKFDDFDAVVFEATKQHNYRVQLVDAA